MARREPLETIQEAADRLGINTRTLRRRIAEGVVPAYRIGNLIRLKPDEVDAALLRRIPTVGSPWR